MQKYLEPSARGGSANQGTTTMKNGHSPLPGSVGCATPDPPFERKDNGLKQSFAIPGAVLQLYDAQDKR